MIFKPILIEAIMRGDKTVTRRPVSFRTAADDAFATERVPCRYREGQYVKIQPGMARESLANIYVVSVRTEPLGAITDADALLEGFADRDEFLDYWRALYGGKDPDLDMLVDRIEFELQEAWLDLCPRCSGSGTVAHPMTYEGVALA